ncbi:MULTISPECIES: hypothetical protein [Luteimonas]|uniref:Uncharacterized protein n=1 Tax=Luteimonas chenhongjianii TaxID=2006110 RepID=A0A290XB62_9GAMM|nr:MULTISPECIES: hypothetical protein [Luteimonas]ATD66228.1 hypothetical protein CNR27_01165 [Luteimonas chenhongjianii]RPD83474.1 hypothetical protein EGK76_15155 [Luteimonas sp. 100069]
MFKYISSTKLNLAILAQMIGIALAVRATPLSLIAGVALFVLGAIVYRRELSRVLASNEPSQ